MRAFQFTLLLLSALHWIPALAWGAHSFPTYRALERVPELTEAPTVAVEPLEAFLRSEEKTIEVLLASQEAWAMAQLAPIPERPANLAFVADPERTDEARKQAFLMALRMAPNSKFALFFQPDPWAGNANGASGATASLPITAVSTSLDPVSGTPYRLLNLRAGDWVAPLTVVASASDEPDFGLDNFLWEDSPSDWGRALGLGKIPYGSANVASSSQEPFHTAYLRENALSYVALPALRWNFLLLRNYQFSTLSALAFRTGHSYWGWRFAGMALHYVQDLTQPLRASLLQGDSSLRLLGVGILASAGWRSVQQDYLAQLSVRLHAVERFEAELLQGLGTAKRENAPAALEKAIHNTERDHVFPDWSDHYLRDTVAPQTAALANRFSPLIQGKWPLEHNEADPLLLDCLTNFGIHSRNAIRGILRSANAM